MEHYVNKIVAQKSDPHRCMCQNDSIARDWGMFHLIFWAIQHQDHFIVLFLSITLTMIIVAITATLHWLLKQYFKSLHWKKPICCYVFYLCFNHVQFHALSCLKGSNNWPWKNHLCQLCNLHTILSLVQHFVYFMHNAMISILKENK